MFMAKNHHETSSMDKKQFHEEKNNLQFRIEKKSTLCKFHEQNQRTASSMNKK